MAKYLTPLPVTMVGSLTTPLPVSLSPNTTSVNIYSENLVAYATVTTILTYTVSSTIFYITGMVGWGDTCGEFLVKVNGVTAGGGRTTASMPVCTLPYSICPIKTIAGDTVTVTAEHYNVATKTMKANLLGE